MRYGAACLLIFSCTFLSADPLLGAGIDQIRQATDAMNAWLGEGENGDRWRRFLRIDQLQTQVAKGDEADPVEVLAVLAKFRRESAGLQSEQFVAVREALEAWLEARDASPAQALSAWVASAQPEFSPVSEEQVKAARDELVGAAESLDAFLASGPKENRDAWHEYLNWNVLQEQLKSEESVDLDLLGSILLKYYEGHPGLEFVPFVELREALLQYRLLLSAKNDPDIQARFNNQLARLSRDLGGETSVAGVSARLAWLDQLGQTPQIVSRVRSGFDAPNVYFSVAAETVTSGLADDVDDESQVNEMILGTRISGVARTVGKLSARLLPREDKAAIEVTLTGQSNTNTVGRQRPVRIYSRGVTEVFGRKRLFVDDSGIFGEPATAQCTTDNDIYSIRTDGRFASRLIQRVAWNRASQQQRQAERIAARRAEVRVSRLMDSRGEETIRSSNDRLEDEVRRPLKQRNIFPRWVRFWSTDERLHMRALQGRRIQLAADSRPPSMPSHNVNIQVHESMVFNTAVNAMGGFLMTDERARDLVKELTGDVPEELEIRQDEDPWSITFDRTQPLSVRFNGNQVVIAIRGRRFTRGDQVVSSVMQIAASYTIEASEGRVMMVRQGDIDVTYPGVTRQLSLAELANKTFMTRKFEGLFKQEILGEGLDLPERWRNLEDLQLEFTSTDRGWLSMGWN